MLIDYGLYAYDVFRVVVVRTKSLHDRSSRNQDLMSVSSTDSADLEISAIKPLRVGLILAQGRVTFALGRFNTSSG